MHCSVDISRGYTTLGKHRVRSFGTILVSDYSEETVFMFFWELIPNERNTVYPENAEYTFFWQIFGGKSNAAARAGRLASGWKT